MRTALVSLALLALGVWSTLPLPAGGAAQANPAPGATTNWANCLACHTVSGSDLPKLADLRPANLGADLPAQCGTCHSEVDYKKQVSDWRHPVQPLALHLACTDCHVAVAHDHSHPPPLPVGDYSASGCYQCHASVRAQRRMPSSHGERQAARCRDCHPPHQPLWAALPAHLVPQPARAGWQGSYDWQKSNSDCLACHPAGQLLYGVTQGFVTLNTENYHALHVQAGRVLCLECHTAHGSFQPKLLRSRLLTGEVLSYTQHSNGGTCNLQCHSIVHDNWQYVNSAY